MTIGQDGEVCLEGQRKDYYLQQFEVQRMDCEAPHIVSVIEEHDHPEHERGKVGA